MDKTKKYTLIFVVTCLLFITVAGIYRLRVPATLDNNEIEVIEKEENEEKQTGISNEQEAKDNQTETKEKDKEIKPSKEPQTTNKKTEPEDIKETTSPPKEEVKESQSVQFIIQGIDQDIINESIKIVDEQTVFDVLKKITTNKQIELKTSGASSIVYIRGINGLNEFDHGPRSGWKYKVNGLYPNMSAGSYKIKDGDQIEWIYAVE